MVLTKTNKVVSVVTPCFNEELNIDSCYEAVRSTFASMKLNLNHSYRYEHIFVDNASNDTTRLKIQALRRKDSRVKYYRNNRNVGSVGNIWIGLTVSKGDLVIPLIPADLQDPPEMIPQFIENWENGYLVIQGVAIKRNESLILQVFRRVFYFLISRLATTYIPSGANEFCAIDRRVLDSVLQTQDQKPYVRGLIHLVGSRTKYINYEKKSRVAGNSKESFRSYLDISINAFISTSVLFPRILIGLGLLVSFFSIGVGFFLAYFTLKSRGWGAVVEPQNLVWGLFFISGLQIFFLGLVAEYIISIHQQVRPRPKSFFEEIDE